METTIEMARRHVREGKQHVASQRRIVRRLADAPAEAVRAMASELLTQFEASLADYAHSLARMERDQRSGRRDADGNLLPMA